MPPDGPREPGHSLASGGPASTGFMLFGGLALLATLAGFGASRLSRPLRLPRALWAPAPLMAALERPG